jgi:hypothetical protein
VRLAAPKIGAQRRGEPLCPFPVLHEMEPCALASALTIQPLSALGALRLWAMPVRQCCRSSVVERILGKAEVVSSILTGSTIFQRFSSPPRGRLTAGITRPSSLQLAETTPDPLRFCLATSLFQSSRHAAAAQQPVVYAAMPGEVGGASQRACGGEVFGRATTVRSSGPAGAVTMSCSTASPGK